MICFEVEKKRRDLERRGEKRRGQVKKKKGSLEKMRIPAQAVRANRTVSDSCTMTSMLMLLFPLFA